MSEANEVEVLVRFLRSTAETISANDTLGIFSARAGSLFRAAEAIERQEKLLAGCHDMLREAAKQFRADGHDGHANMCDMHADCVRKPNAANNRQP